jgi:hypothetical protein
LWHKRLVALCAGHRRQRHLDPAGGHEKRGGGSRPGEMVCGVVYRVRSVAEAAEGDGMTFRFFTGLHQPSDAGRVDAGFISVHRLAHRKAPMRISPDWPWIMDSGAFSTILIHHGYPEPVAAYAAEIRRWASNGHLLAAVAQDFMCEAHMLALTGLTVADHQCLTVDRYDALLRCDVAGVTILPVLQGYSPASYVEHLRRYGASLAPGAWVGVGSICKRNGNPAAIEDVLLAIHGARPDLRLHGFGIKTTALESGLVRDLLHSADSMAWSYGERMQGRSPNDVRAAARFGLRIRTMPVQTTFAGRLVA